MTSRGGGANVLGAASSRDRASPREKFCKVCEAPRRDLRTRCACGTSRDAANRLPSAPSGSKRCRRCDRILPVDAFQQNARMRDGRQSWCRTCQVVRTQEWRLAHPEYVAAYNLRRHGPVIPERQCHHCRRFFMPMRHDQRRCSPCARHSRGPRASSTARGYGMGWRALRDRVLAKEPVCRLCGGLATQVDHIVAKVLGGTDARTNLRSLCTPCHGKKTGRDRAAALARRR